MSSETKPPWFVTDAVYLKAELRKSVPHLDLSLKEAKANVRRVNPDLDIIEMSCTGGEGIPDWIAWLHQRYQEKFGTESRHKMFDY